MSENGNNGSNHGGNSDNKEQHGNGGERRYGKPASVARSYAKPSGERRSYAKPSGERRSFGKPADGENKERRYGKPADGARSFGKPVSGEHRSFGKPADGESKERRYGKPADGARSFGKPASGERRSFSKLADGENKERRYGKPADGARSFGKPVSGERRSFGKPADGENKERRYGKPADGARSFGKPASGERRSFGKPADGARSFGKPSGEHRSFRRPADGAHRSFGKPSVERRVFAKPAAPAENTGLTLSARRVALDVLKDVHENGAFAALSLQEHLTKAKLQPLDRRFATSIVYSTLENQLKIDFALDKLMERPIADTTQRDILRMSACQILFYDRVPDSAAVNEGVNLAKAMGMEGMSGFLNAVLRNLVRGKDEIAWPKKEDGLAEYLSVMGSTPMWLVNRLIADYGDELAEQIVMYRNDEHPTVIRPNLLTMDDAAFREMLDKKAWKWSQGVAPHAYLISGANEINLDNDYRNGNFSIQGQSSMLAAEAVQVKAGTRVLDACAAPGGKACYMAETMQNTGRVFAWELHERRALLLESAKRRLKLENLRISVRDASEYREDLDRTMDAVLLDAPCSGTGVIAEKPDLKYRLKEEDIAAIVQTQKKLLNTLCRYVRPGGTLVYSTCSILPEENFEQVQAFLAEHEDFTVEPLPLSYPEALRSKQTALGLQLFAHRDGVEGFFIVRMHRARS